MRALIQRVSEAAVDVEGQTIARIGPGLLILLGVAQDDDETKASALAAKVVRLRIFENKGGHFDLDLRQTGGQALVVSQFTLYADTRKGRRPSFSRAARPEKAQPLYQAFCQALREEGVEVKEGLFGALMEVSLVNHGPVTIDLEV
jgi:D-tyrosyl-tRNA(Tyr) deacylase